MDQNFHICLWSGWQGWSHSSFNRFFWDIFPKSVYPPTHPRVFVIFGKTKGEIWVEKGDFWGNLGGFWGVWTLFGNQPPQPPSFERNLPKKKRFFYAFPMHLELVPKNTCFTRSYQTHLLFPHALHCFVFFFHAKVLHNLSASV